MGAAWARHAMCESAFAVTINLAVMSVVVVVVVVVIIINFIFCMTKSKKT